MLQLCWVKHKLHICLHVFYNNTALPNILTGIAHRYTMMDDWIIFIIIKEIKQPRHSRLDCTASEGNKCTIQLSTIVLSIETICKIHLRHSEETQFVFFTSTFIPFDYSYTHIYFLRVGRRISKC